MRCAGCGEPIPDALFVGGQCLACGADLCPWCFEHRRFCRGCDEARRKAAGGISRWLAARASADDVIPLDHIEHVTGFEPEWAKEDVDAAANQLSRTGPFSVRIFQGGRFLCRSPGRTTREVTCALPLLRSLIRILTFGLLFGPTTQERLEALEERIETLRLEETALQAATVTGPGASARQRRLREISAELGPLEKRRDKLTERDIGALKTRGIIEYTREKGVGKAEAQEYVAAAETAADQQADQAAAQELIAEAESRFLGAGAAACERSESEPGEAGVESETDDPLSQPQSE